MTTPRGLIIAARHSRFMWRKRAELAIKIIVIVIIAGGIAAAMWSMK